MNIENLHVRRTNSKRMFPFISATWNPLGGACCHNCCYCWAKDYANRLHKEKYSGLPRIAEKQLNKRNFGSDDFIFVCSMTDLFNEQVNAVLIKQVLKVIICNPQTAFLLLTKNPHRYLHFLDFLPVNAILGATIETNLSYNGISSAPPPLHRILNMEILAKVTDNLLFVSVEPCLNFNLSHFSNSLASMNLWGLAYGYDNYNNDCTANKEPTLLKTRHFLKDFREKSPDTKIFLKTIRKRRTEAV